MDGGEGRLQECPIHCHFISAPLSFRTLPPTSIHTGRLGSCRSDRVHRAASPAAASIGHAVGQGQGRRPRRVPQPGEGGKCDSVTVSLWKGPGSTTCLGSSPRCVVCVCVVVVGGFPPSLTVGPVSGRPPPFPSLTHYPSPLHSGHFRLPPCRQGRDSGGCGWRRAGDPLLTPLTNAPHPAPHSGHCRLPAHWALPPGQGQRRLRQAQGRWPSTPPRSPQQGRHRHQPTPPPQRRLFRVLYGPCRRRRGHLPWGYCAGHRA